MVVEASRLPGISFESPTPASIEDLPRMDVAAFVGFAAAGPLHLPVAVESPRHFRDVFGPDPVLAWDDERGIARSAHLGGAVEAFFVNGGTRCWVVRVAESGAVVRHDFKVPGLICSDTLRSNTTASTMARARAAGSWCEDLAVGTALSRDPLPLRSPRGGDAIALHPGRYRVDLSTDRSRVQPGDLLEVGFGPDAPVLMLFAERVLPIPGGVSILSAGLDASGVTVGAFWIQPSGAAPADDDFDPETVPPLQLNEASAVAWVQATIGSPPTRPAVRRLSFEILVWKGAELTRRLDDLAFGSRHPRFWAALPTDEEMFKPWIGSGATMPLEGLAREVSAPRFPIAGPAEACAYYLPWGMGRRRVSESAIALPASATTGPALERDGLARFGAQLFVDEHLAPVNAGALLGEAEHRLHVNDVPLSGMHCLLPIEEASIVAVPDAVHRGWSRELPTERTPLGSPALQVIGEPDAALRHPLLWTAVEGAWGYTLQRDFDPEFAAPVVVYEGVETSAAASLPRACPREVFFRVRAFRDGEVGPWSNTRGALLPRPDFTDRAGRRPDAPILVFIQDSLSLGPALDWTLEETADSVPVVWSIEEATDPGFGSTTEFSPTGMSPGYAPLPERRFGARYYRVRGNRGGLLGPWSNTVRVIATERAVFTEPSAREYEASNLLAIHRALLRFAAARGDLLALLALPDHYRADDALEHVGRLAPGGREEFIGPPSPPARFLRVPALSEGEATVMSHGALYHPWTLSRRSGDARRPHRRSPPEGALAGLMAAMARDEGAWHAPANRPLFGVAALEPDLGFHSIGRLILGGVNPLSNERRGFVARSEDTLGGERALGRVHVRRLMILLRRLAVREGEPLVFEPHGPDLRRRLRLRLERMLEDLFQRGAFAGRDASDAFRVVADESVNPPESVDAGRLVIELRITPAAALANLTVRLITAGPGLLAVEEI
jgi:hypothetical protein